MKIKIIKIASILAVMSLFVSVPSTAYAGDCSGLKVLSHKWIMCHGGSDKYSGDGSTSVSGEDKESFNEKYKTLSDLLTKKEKKRKEKAAKEGKESFNERCKTLSDVLKGC